MIGEDDHFIVGCSYKVFYLSVVHCPVNTGAGVGETVVSLKYSRPCPQLVFVMVGESYQSVSQMNIYATLKKINAKKRNVNADSNGS